MLNFIIKKTGYFFLLFIFSTFILFHILYQSPDKIKKYKVAGQFGNIEYSGWVSGKYVEWLNDLLLFDLGEAEIGFYKGEKVYTVIISEGHLMRSLIIIFFTLSIAISVSLISVINIDKPGKKANNSYFFAAIPSFLLGYLLMKMADLLCGLLVRNLNLERPLWYPMPNMDNGYMNYLLAIASLVIGDGLISEYSQNIAQVSRRIKNSMFYKIYKAKRIPFAKNMFYHILNQLIVLTSGRITLLLSTVIIIEVVFRIDGIGRLVWNHTFYSDGPDVNIIMGVSVFTIMSVFAGRIIKEFIISMEIEKRM